MTQDPPHSDEAERAILGACLIEPACITRVLDLDAMDFYRHANRDLFAALVDMSRSDTKVDYLTVENYLRDCGKLERVGGIEYICKLADDVPTLSGLQEYARIVSTKARARTLIAGMGEIQRRLFEGDDPDEMAPDLARFISIGTVGKYREYTIQDALADLEAYQSGEAPGLLNVGFDVLERYSPAMGELTVLAARPSVGKTALAVEMAERIARRGDAVLFLSLEMSGQGITFRRIYYDTGVPSSRLRRAGTMTDVDWSHTGAAMARMRDLPVRLYSGVFRQMDLEAVIRAEKIRSNVRAVFIDHIGKVRLPRREPRVAELGVLTEGLAATAKELRVAVFALCQLNRQSEARDSKRPSLSDLRDSGEIEENADNTWLLYRESKYKEDADDTLEIIIAKARDGSTGIARARLDPKTGRISDGEV
uniref:DNA 5'-3' helicase n=1 Tax=viral metagenome TaxID=1070528 RepID=A0A6M3LGS5_9ZZZZ